MRINTKLFLVESKLAHTFTEGKQTAKLYDQLKGIVSLDKPANA